TAVCAGLGGAVVPSQATPGGDLLTELVAAAYTGLPGEIFADQQPAGRMRRVDKVSQTGGVFSLPAGWQASSIGGFLGFVAPFMAAKLGYGAQLGSPLTQKKRLEHLGLVASDIGATALSIGQRFDLLDPMPAIEAGATVPAGTTWSHYDEAAVEMP